MFLLTVCIYLVIGVVVEYIEEIISLANADKIFREHTEELGFDINGIFIPIMERIEDYSMTWFLTDLNDLVLWPFGIVWWLRGMNRLKHMSKSEINELFRNSSKY